MNTIKFTKNNSVALVTLHRPDVHNAFNEDMMNEIHKIFSDLENDDGVKIVYLTGEGASFCAGGDLNYMKSAASKTREQNVDESLTMAKMFTAINELSKPVVCYVNGAAFGGGVGLVASCDIVIAHESAKFSLSEVKLGLNPSVISPFVIAKIGAAMARRYFLTAERFSAASAQNIGLVHEVVNDQTRDAVMSQLMKDLLQNGPAAMSRAKNLIRKNLTLKNRELTEFTANEIAELRASSEAQEGISAFFAKRKPTYARES